MGNHEYEKYEKTSMKNALIFLLLFANICQLKAEIVDIGLGYSISTMEKTVVVLNGELHDFKDSNISIGNLNFDLYVGYHPTILASGKTLSVDLESRFEHPIFLYRFDRVDSRSPYDLWVILVILDSNEFRPVYLHSRAESVTIYEEKMIIDTLRTVKKRVE